MCSDKKPNIHDVVDNLKKPMPLSQKVGSILKNNLLKIVRRQSCCGHPGEPGC